MRRGGPSTNGPTFGALVLALLVFYQSSRPTPIILITAGMDLLPENLAPRAEAYRRHQEIPFRVATRWIASRDYVRPSIGWLALRPDRQGVALILDGMRKGNGYAYSALQRWPNEAMIPVAMAYLVEKRREKRLEEGDVLLAADIVNAAHLEIPFERRNRCFSGIDWPTDYIERGLRIGGLEGQRITKQGWDMRLKERRLLESVSKAFAAKHRRSFERLEAWWSKEGKAAYPMPSSGA